MGGRPLCMDAAGGCVSPAGQSCGGLGLRQGNSSSTELAGRHAPERMREQGSGVGTVAGGPMREGDAPDRPPQDAEGGAGGAIAILGGKAPDAALCQPSCPGAYQP
jgi:hypothetical protein